MVRAWKGIRWSELRRIDSVKVVSMLFDMPPAYEGIYWIIGFGGVMEWWRGIDGLGIGQRN